MRPYFSFEHPHGDSYSINSVKEHTKPVSPQLSQLHMSRQNAHVQKIKQINLKIYFKKYEPLAMVDFKEQYNMTEKVFIE